MKRDEAELAAPFSILLLLCYVYRCNWYCTMCACVCAWLALYFILAVFTCNLYKVTISESKPQDAFITPLMIMIFFRLLFSVWENVRPLSLSLSVLFFTLLFSASAAAYNMDTIIGHVVMCMYDWIGFIFNWVGTLVSRSMSKALWQRAIARRRIWDDFITRARGKINGH